MTIKQLLNIMFVCMTIFMVTACDGSGSKSDLIQFVEKLRQDRLQNKKTAKPEAIAAPQPATYLSARARTPFKIKEVSTEIKKATSTLQSYPLSALEFVGTISQNNRIYAYIVTPDKMIYQVGIGDPIGDKNGKVSRILPNQMDILEQGGTGDDQLAIKRTITLQLKE